MNETKLLPCPFCGATASGYEIEAHEHSTPLKAMGIPDHPGSYVIEGDCACGSGLIGSTKEEVKEKWNRRAPSNCLHQIQEPCAAEQAAWHAGLDEGRAQAPQPDDMRDKVTLALGLSLAPKGTPAFAWSYLLDSIRELVKCEEELVLLKAGMEMSKAAPTAVAVPDERAAFEAWASTQYAEINLARDGDEYRYALAKDWWPVWKASRAALAAFDPATKVCSHNCGQSTNDPRSENECKFLCDLCWRVEKEQSK